MFDRFRRESELDKTIDEIARDMRQIDAASDEYQKMYDRMVALMEVRDNSRRRVSPDTLAVVFGNLAGIAMIVGHERAHLVGSKALQFVKTLK